MLLLAQLVQNNAGSVVFDPSVITDEVLIAMISAGIQSLVVFILIYGVYKVHQSVKEQLWEAEMESKYGSRDHDDPPPREYYKQFEK